MFGTCAQDVHFFFFLKKCFTKRYQWQALDWNQPAIDFYVKKLGARERVEDNDARWMNFIMDRAAIARFVTAGAP